MKLPILAAIAATLLASPAGCERPANPNANRTEPPAAGAGAPPPASDKLDESCRGRYYDLRIVGRILDEKNVPQGDKPMLMTAANLQGLGEITDGEGVHVDQGYSNIVRSTYVMCLTVERKANDPYTYHVKLTFRIQTNADGWKVECSLYDNAIGLGALDLAHGKPESRGVIHSKDKKVVAAEATCEYQFPPVR